MIHQIFQACVWVLNVAGQWLGIGYEAINVWVFVVLWPIATLSLLAIIGVQAVQLRRLRRGNQRTTAEVKA